MNMKFSFETVCVKHQKELLLDNVEGFAHSSELMALMGPSGSGKSTLLNYLSFRRSLIGLPKRNMSGSVKLDGRPLHPKFRCNIAYVPQESYLFPFLTLAETLQFYSVIKMDRKTDLQTRQNKITEVCQLMNLSGCLGIAIGGEEVNGLSGGERKRAGVVVELLNDPVILFLDEPTSSLDSSMAADLMDLLKNFARSKNAIVISSIHQPSSAVFAMFDRLLLLYEGKSMYFGPASQVGGYLAQVGFDCPDKCNMADFMLGVLGSENAQILHRHYRDTRVPTAFTDVTTYDGPMLHSIESRCRPDMFQLFKAVFKRTHSIVMRRSASTLALFEFFFYITLIAIIWFQTPLSESSLKMVSGLISFAASVQYFNTSELSLMAYLQDMEVIKYEMMSKMYPLWLYYVSGVISQLLLLLMGNTVFWLIIYFACGLPSSSFFVVSLLLSTMFIMLCHALTLLISSFLGGVTENSAVFELVFTFSYLISGLYNSNLPKWLNYVRYVSPFFINLNNQVAISIIGNGGLPCESNVSVYPTCVSGGLHVGDDEVLAHMDNYVPVCHLALLDVLLCIFFYIASYFILSWSI